MASANDYRRLRAAVVLMGLLATFAGAQTAQKPAGIALASNARPAGTSAQRLIDDGTIIENVTLISPERVAPLLHADVVIRNGRIAETKLIVGGGEHLD
jgi:hypothetical protein